ncbi:tail fiber assembly protein [Pseudomonas sp. LJDD11]|uniref:tail fiber assembly protein n=1 Tax=Pseudomonas sp. LJDD11 TaxID=2931984 RepID=UPI00211C8469|nr:tail fiber assembly protein [Pseudomonas sp. LJDD11]MCQ9426667.1 tail fiber assembly protein [Pseudomonas sp. LJDD11]
MAKRVLYSLQTFRVLEWQDTDKMNYGAPGWGMAVAVIPESDWLRQNTLQWYFNGSLTDMEPTIAPPVITPEEILFRNGVTRRRLMSEAQISITPLQYAVDLEMETDDEAAQLLRWKRYVVEVNRIDLTLPDPDWPTLPEEFEARPERAFY